jgi:hypothetical protein
MCVPGGVEMYVAKHAEFVIKRMPDTGGRHHVACPSFEPESALLPTAVGASFHSAPEQMLS